MVYGPLAGEKGLGHWVKCQESHLVPIIELLPVPCITTTLLHGGQPLRGEAAPCQGHGPGQAVPGTHELLVARILMILTLDLVAATFKAS